MKSVASRTRSAAAILTAVTLSLSACGLSGGDDAPSGEGTGAAGASIPKPEVDCDVPAGNLDAKAIDTAKPTGTIRFATQGLKTDFGGFFNPLIAKFEAEHPGVKVAWEDTPTADDFDARMVSDARTCVMADVVNVPSSTIMALSQGNLLLDLDVKAPDSGKEFLPDVWKGLGIGADGSHTAYPWYWGPQIVTYNKNLFTQAGLDPNAAPKTWDELVTQSKTIAEKSGGKTQALWGNQKWSFLPQWKAMGAKVMKDDGSAFTFADEAQPVQWLTDMAALYKAGAISKDSVTGKPDPSQAFTAGTLAFGSPNASFLRNVKKNAPALYPQTGVSGPLLSDGGTVDFDAQYISVASTTKNAAAALAFAQYVTNAENQLAWAKDPNVVIFPSATKALDDAFFAAPAGNDPMGQARSVAAEAAKKGQLSPADFYLTGKVKDTVMEAIQLAVTGEKEPKQALADAQTEVNKLVARTK